MYRTARQVTKKYGANHTLLSNYEVTLPAGLRCTPIREGGTAGKFFLDEFPTELFPRDSFERHDAVHYGIVLEPSEVVED